MSDDKEVEERKPYRYTPKDKKRLKQIAVDLHAGLIFCDRHIPDLGDKPSMLRIVFMPLCFMKKEDIEDFDDQNIQFFFEYTSKASPRMVSGMPQFSSMEVLDKNDCKRMLKMHKKLIELADKI